MPAVAEKLLPADSPAVTAGALETSRPGFGVSPVHPLQQRLADHFAGQGIARHPDDYAWGAKAAIILAAALTTWMALGTIVYLVLKSV